MEKPFFFLVIIALYLPLVSIGQDSIDSLELEKGNLFYQKAGAIFSADQDSAIALLNKALIHLDKSNSFGDYIFLLNTLTTIHYQREEFNLYQAFSKRAVKESEEKMLTNHPQYAIALNNLNLYYYDLGNYEASINTLKKSLSIKTENNASSMDLAFAYSNIGAVLTQKGDYPEALEYFLKSMDFSEDTLQKNKSSDVELLVGRAKNGIAWAYFKNNKLDRALAYYESSLHQLMQIDGFIDVIQRDMITAFQGMAKIHIHQKNYSKAIKKIKEAIVYQKKDDSYKKAHSFELMGDISLAQRNYKEAIIQYKKALGIAEKFYAAVNLPYYARKYNGLANAYQASGQYKKALPNYQAALKILAPEFTSTDPGENPIPSNLFSKPDALEILSGKGATLWEQYNKEKNRETLEQSYQTYQVGIEVISAIRQDVLTAEAKNTLSEKTVPIYEGAIRAALTLYQNTQETTWLEQAFILAESNKSLLLLESVNEQAALGIQGLPDSLLQKDKELRLSIAYYQRQLIEAQSKKEETDLTRIKEWKQQLFDLKAELQTLTDHFEADYPRFYQLKYQSETPDLRAWQTQSASNGQAVIEYFVGEEKAYVFVLWEEGLQYFTIDEKDVVFTAIGQLRSSISELPTDAAVLQNYQTFTSSAHQLYQALLAPALAALPAEITSLKIIPDDQLNYIPFDLLLMEAAEGEQPVFAASQLAYVLEDYSISYDYSATWMLKNETHKNLKYEQDFIAYAPSFKKAAIADGTRALRACQESELYDLECSREEVEGINALMNGETRLSETALKAAFAREAGQYRIIHMATHACADETNPLFNKIFLSDDYLSNADLYNTELNAELVVLSACNTGSGKLVKGEGVLSLARGFVQAGCASSVVSRWSVDDCTTSDIMYRFYSALRGGESKDGALRQAKLDYLAEADQLYAHPYFWSAFVAYGEMDAMDLRDNKYWYLWLLIGLMFTGLLFFYRQRKATT